MKSSLKSASKKSGFLCSILQWASQKAFGFLSISSKRLYPPKGTSSVYGRIPPDFITNKNMPAENISAFWGFSQLSKNNSGALKYLVPWLLMESSPIIYDKSKSQILSLKSFPKRRLSGLISRWETPDLCKYSNPSMSYLKKVLASLPSKGTFLFVIRSKKSPKGQYSSIIQELKKCFPFFTACFLSWQYRMLTIFSCFRNWKVDSFM